MKPFLRLQACRKKTNFPNYELKNQGMYCNLKITASILVGILMFGGCKSAKKATSTTTQDNSHNLTHQDQKPVEDPSGKYVLFVGKVETANAGGKINFCVHEKEKMSLLKEVNYRPGYVKWVGAGNLEYQDVPGMIKKDQDMSAFVHLLNFNQPQQP